MFKLSLNRNVLAFCAAAVAMSYPLQLARADIITDIEEIDKEKAPEKQKEKKKEKEAAKPKSQKAKEKTLSAPAQADDPSAANEKPQLIPEPVDEVIAPPKPVKPVDPKQVAKNKAARQKAPVHWQSKGTTTGSKDLSTITLKDDVIITQSDMRLESDEAKVTFQPKGSAETGVKTAFLTGKVAITRYSEDPTERMNAKSDKATFDNQAQVVTLDGNARLWRDGGLVQGDRITYEVASGQVRIDKARGVVQPERMKK
jgi:lipopolysaccharide transport protein LptA